MFLLRRSVAAVLAGFATSIIFVVINLLCRYEFLRPA